MDKQDLQDGKTMADTMNKINDIINKLNFRKDMTIGMYFKEHQGFIKYSTKIGFTLLGMVSFNAPTGYPCMIDMKKLRSGIEEDDDYAVIDMEDKADVTKIYGMEVPSQDEMDLFKINIFPVKFEVSTEDMREAVNDGKSSHIGKSISFAKISLIKTEFLRVKTYKGRNLIKDVNVPIDKVSVIGGKKNIDSVSAGLLEAILDGDKTNIYLHPGMMLIENKLSNELLNFKFIIYKTEI